MYYILLSRSTEIMKMIVADTKLESWLSVASRDLELILAVEYKRRVR
jgi:hypothetical protein